MKEYETLDQLLAELPALALRAADTLKGTDGLFLLEESAGRRVWIRLEDGALTFPEAPAEAPVCTVCAAEKDLLAIMAGRMKPMSAILRGKIRIKGNPAPLLSLIRAIP